MPLGAVAAAAWSRQVRGDYACAGCPAKLTTAGRASGPPARVGASHACRQRGQQQRLELPQHSGVVVDVDFPKTLSGSERISAECSDISRICEK